MFCACPQNVCLVLRCSQRGWRLSNRSVGQSVIWQENLKVSKGVPGAVSWPPQEWYPLHSPRESLGVIVVTWLGATISGYFALKIFPFSVQLIFHMLLLATFRPRLPFWRDCAVNKQSKPQQASARKISAHCFRLKPFAFWLPKKLVTNRMDITQARAQWRHYN